MKKVILTKGLPASGKTTWALELIKNNPGQYKRINKDDLRAMLDGGKWSGDNEKFILNVRDSLILQSIEAGKHVIIDDTNLHTKHEDRIKQLVKGKAIVQIQDFTDVDIETCIKRDLLRPVSVGEKVIRGMYNQYLKPKIQKPAYVEGKPIAIICDLDGTLALFGDANPYDRNFLEDEVNNSIAEIVHTEQEIGNSVIIVSGRNGKYKDQTMQWLDKNHISYQYFFMRKADDTRKDVIVKKEIYDTEIKGKFNISFVLDDRNQVVEMWRQEGLTCLQVADGDF